MAASTQKKINNAELNDLQVSILRLFDQGIDESYMLELRQLLMDHFDRKLQAELNEVVSQKGYTEADYRKMLHDDRFATQ